MNPLDAWGTGNAAEDIFIECMHALLDDPDTAALAFCVDLTPELVEEAGYTRVANEVFAATGEARGGAVEPGERDRRKDAAFVRGQGIPVLEGTTTGLRAFRHLFEYRDFRARPPAEAASPGRPRRPRPGGGAGWPRTCARATEACAAGRLRRPGGRAAWPSSLAEARRRGATGRLAGGAEDGRAGRRAQVGRGRGVGWASRTGRRCAWPTWSCRLGSGPGSRWPLWRRAGVELALGIVRDDQFGPLVLVAPAGSWSRSCTTVAWRCRRWTRPGAGACWTGWRSGRCWTAFAGRRRSTSSAVRARSSQLSSLAIAVGDRIAALDVNPLIAGPNGCVAVDALVIAPDEPLDAAAGSPGSRRSRSDPADGRRCSRATISGRRVAVGARRQAAAGEVERVRVVVRRRRRSHRGAAGGRRVLHERQQRPRVAVVGRRT